MTNFKDFKYGWSFTYASAVRDYIYDPHNDFYLVDITDYFEPDDVFIEKSLKPNKVSLLHDFISFCILEESYYSLRKLGEEAYPEIQKVLETYNIPYIHESEFNEEDDEYRFYLLDILEQSVLPFIVEEVFNLLFQDRLFLSEFNKHIAEITRKMEKQDFNNVLKTDGVFMRCTYWPTWLIQGLYHRDKGHCAICQSDISPHISTGKKPAVDHIVPLNLGGVNDPTNLQLLCQTCNSQKGGNETTTSGYTSSYW